MEQFQVTSSPADGQAQVILQTLPAQMVASGTQSPGQTQILQVSQGNQILTQAGQQILTQAGQQIVLQTMSAQGQTLQHGQTLQIQGQGGQLQQVIIQQPQQTVQQGAQQTMPQVIQTQDGQTIIYQPVQTATAPDTTGQAQVAQTVQLQTSGGVIQVPMTMPTQSSAGTASSAVPTAAAVALPNGTTTNANGQLVLVVPGTGGAPTIQRIPIPEQDVLDDQPLYVNAKQYHRILKRRQARARLEAQGKIPKERRKYLHESRHRHAMNRVRGDGGRFYSTEELQEQMMAAQQAGDGSGGLMGANVFKLEKEGEQNGNSEANTPVMTSASEALLAPADASKIVSITLASKTDTTRS